MQRPAAGAPLLLAALIAFGSAVSLQAARDRAYPRDDRQVERMLYVRSGAVLKRLTLSFDALAADVYWIRAIQHYGGERLGMSGRRRYELLYPLLDLTTTLDPYFNIAYRFGAIFLSEGYPGGPGRPDRAVALLRKGIANMPGKWQYYMDIGFVHYWHLRDYIAAASWIQRAAEQPGAPNWLRPLAASMLVQGEDRAAARMLWQQVRQSEEAWLRNSAERALLQLDALDQLEFLQERVARVPRPAGGYSWPALARLGIVPGVPTDPTRTPYRIDPDTGRISVDPASPLSPMPAATRRELPQVP